MRASLPSVGQWAQGELQEKQSLFRGRGIETPHNAPRPIMETRPISPANEVCGEVRHVPPTPDAREGRNRRDGTVIWLLVSSRRWLLVSSHARGVLEPYTALRTRCLQRHRVAGSSPAEPDRQGPHEAGRSKIALVSSSSSLELGTFNKDHWGQSSFGYLCVRVCPWAPPSSRIV